MVSVRGIISQNNIANHNKLQEGVAGCYYCLSCFPVDRITKWVKDKHGMTACCPNCTVDTVLPEKALQDIGEVLFRNSSLTLPVLYKCLEECRKISF